MEHQYAGWYAETLLFGAEQRTTSRTETPGDKAGPGITRR